MTYRFLHCQLGEKNPDSLKHPPSSASNHGSGLLYFPAFNISLLTKSLWKGDSAVRFMKKNTWQKLVSYPYTRCGCKRFLLSQAGSPLSLCSWSPPITFSHSPTDLPFQRSLFSVQCAESALVSLFHIISAVREGASKSRVHKHIGVLQKQVLRIFRVCVYHPSTAFLRPRYRQEPRPGATAPSTSKGHLPDQDWKANDADGSNLAWCLVAAWRSCYP